MASNAKRTKAIRKNRDDKKLKKRRQMEAKRRAKAIEDGTTIAL